MQPLKLFPATLAVVGFPLIAIAQPQVDRGALQRGADGLLQENSQLLDRRDAFEHQDGVQTPEEPIIFNTQPIKPKQPQIRIMAEEGACPGDTPLEKVVRAHRKHNPNQPVMFTDPVTGKKEKLEIITGWKDNGDGTVSAIGGPVLLNDC